MEEDKKITRSCVRGVFRSIWYVSLGSAAFGALAGVNNVVGCAVLDAAGYPDYQDRSGLYLSGMTGGATIGIIALTLLSLPCTLDKISPGIILSSLLGMYTLGTVFCSMLGYPMLLPLQHMEFGQHVASSAVGTAVVDGSIALLFFLIAGCVILYDTVLPEENMVMPRIKQPLSKFFGGQDKASDQQAQPQDQQAKPGAV